MRVLLIGAEVEENLAVRYLAAAVERGGHEAKIAAFSNHDDRESVLATVRALRPEVIGFSMTFQRRAQEFGELAVALRDGGYGGHLVVGGHFPTFAWREVLERYPAIDTVIRHEGELALTELCDALAGGRRPEVMANIRGLVWRATGGALVANEVRPLLEDLDGLPFPKRIGEPQVHMGIPTAFVVGSRGCYGHCAFCCINAYISGAGGSRHRARSVESVADELALLRRTRGARMFVFHDDDFFTRDRARDFARVTALRDALVARDVRDIALVVKARPDDVDPEVFRVLQEIGLLRVYIGIEAGCSQGLKTLGRGVDLAANERAIRLLRELDVYACYNLLLFDPDSTTAALRESVELVRRHADIPMNFCRTEVYVGTPLMTRLARAGRLVGDVFGWDYVIADPAAERALRLFAYSFLERNFRCDGLMNATLGLGYHLHLLQHFYPHAYTAALRGRTIELIRKVNLDCVMRMNRIFDFADTAAAENADAFAECAERTAAEVEGSNHALEAEVAETTLTLLRAARSRKASSTALWRSIAAATLAMSPLSCKPPGMLPPADPPPPPVDAGALVVPDGDRFAEPPPSLDAGPVIHMMPPDPPPPAPAVPAARRHGEEAPPTAPTRRSAAPAGSAARSVSKVEERPSGRDASCDSSATLGAMKLDTRPRVIIRRCSTYDVERIRTIVREGLEELGLRPKGRTLVKPNVVASGPSFPHAYTRPEFVEGVLRALRDRDDGNMTELAVGERCGITMPTRVAFDGGEYYPMFKRVGVKHYHFEEEPQVEIRYTHAGRLRDYVFTPEPVANADFFVNCPKFKSHPWTTVTFSMKNYIGIQDDRHRLIDHDHRLNEKVADLQYIVQPQFIAIDAITAGAGRMLTPAPFDLGLVIMGNNQVAFDSVCSRIIGLDPASIEHIRLASERGFGPMDLESIELSGDVTLDEARARASGFEVGLVRVEKYFEGTKISAYAGPPPEREHSDYCWGGCPGAIEEAIEILRLYDRHADEKMPRLHVVFGAYEGPIPAAPGEKVIFIGDCATFHGEVNGKLVSVESLYKDRSTRDPYTVKHDDIYAKMVDVTAKLTKARNDDTMRLTGCPVSVAEQVLALASLGGTKNPYFSPVEAVRFNKAYFEWRATMLAKRLGGTPYQVQGPCHRGDGAPEVTAPIDTKG